jgi:hypothetical protein
MGAYSPSYADDDEKDVEDGEEEDENMDYDNDIDSDDGSDNDHLGINQITSYRKCIALDLTYSLDFFL